jgi:hypothetical protein
VAYQYFYHMPGVHIPNPHYAVITSSRNKRHIGRYCHGHDRHVDSILCLRGKSNNVIRFQDPNARGRTFGVKDDEAAIAGEAEAVDVSRVSF